MKIIQRILLSISGRKIKSFLLLAVTFLLGTFIATSYSINQATKNLEKVIKSQLSPVVQIQIPSLDDLLMVVYGNENIDEFKVKYKEQFSELDNIFEKFIKDNRVSHGEIKYRFNPNLLKLVSERDIINCLGINSNEPVDALEGEFVDLEGRFFSDKELEDGEDVAILIKNKINSYEKLELGDEIPIQYYEPLLKKNVIDKKYKIIGIYYVDDSEDQNIYFKYSGFQASKDSYIYVPKNNLKNLSEQLTDIYQNQVKNHPDYPFKNDERYGMYYNSSVYMRLNSMDDLNSFTRDLKEALKNYPEFKVNTQSSSYNDVEEGVNNLKNIAMVILVIAILAVISIMMMVLYITVRERRHEIGIYASLGESKKNIVKQIIGEVLIIGLIGLAGSTFVGHAIGNQLSNQMTKQLIQQEASVEIKEMLEEFEIEITKEYVATILLSGTVILTLGSLIPVRYILKLNPKDVLLK